MQKHIFTILCAMLLCTVTQAQNQRYKDMIFDQADVIKDQNYAADSVKANKRDDYKFDLYMPHNDEQKKRPLIIWMHGGAFILGSKKDKNIRLWSETFARRGYVCAAIDYREGKLTYLLNFDKVSQSAYPAILDARQAVRYFKEHAADYGIDPQRIILAGNSAGGIMALQTAFSNNRELSDSLKVQNPARYGSLKDGPTKVLAVVNFWGSILNIDWLKNQATPVVSVYGSHDKIVDPEFKKGTYGSKAIYEKGRAMKRPDDVKVFEGYGHELHKHFNPLPLHFGNPGIKRRWLEAGQFAADFLAKLL